MSPHQDVTSHDGRKSIPVQNTPMWDTLVNQMKIKPLLVIYVSLLLLPLEILEQG